MRPLVIAGLVGLCMAVASCRRPAYADPDAADRGSIVIGQQQCGSCHVIPGIPNADGIAGPPLGGIARRSMIAGVIPNTPGGLITWLRTPQAVVPGNAMPDMGLSEQQARDVAAYLDTLQ
ncbi:MAG TPA: c-type cytochrome [Caulobacteraceae bacterium]